MKTIDSQMGLKDPVIEELHGHKRSITREHGDDIAVLLRDLMDRQGHDARVVTSIKGEPGGPANRSQPIRGETNRTSAAAGSDR